MRRQGASFVCGAGVDVHESLATWWPTPQSWPFVHTIAVAPELQHYRLQMNEEDPYTHAFFLFYSFRKLTRTITVWGGLTWQQADRLQGRIDLCHDLLQDRAFPMPATLKHEDSAAIITKIWLPLVGGGGASTATYPQLMCELDVIMSGTTSSRSDSTEFCALFSLLAGAIEAKLGTLYSIAGTTLDLSVVQRRFHASCLSYTYGWLYRALSAANEASILAALPASQSVEKAHALDRQHFLKRWPDSAPPNWVILVPAEQVAATTGPFCMQTGGIYRLCYKDAFNWIWHMHGTQTRLLVSHPSAQVLDDQGLLDDMARRVVLHYSQHTHTQQANGRGQATRFEGESFAIEGEQALLDTLPPCLRNVMGAHQFPADQMRWPIVAALQRAGVDEASVAAWFEAKNAAYPHPKIRDARARWNYEYAWRVGYTPRPCKKFVQLGDCPFVDLVPHTTDIEELTHSCQLACAPAERNPFTGPHNLVRRALYRRKSLVLPPSPTCQAQTAAAAMPEEEQDDVETIPEPSSEDVTEPSSAAEEDEDN